MSWSVSMNPVPAEQFLDELDKVDFPKTTPREECDCARSQLDAAKEVARALFTSGCVGRGTDNTLFGFSLSGHAVPNHDLDQDWTYESVYVGLHRQIRPAHYAQQPSLAHEQSSSSLD